MGHPLRALLGLLLCTLFLGFSPFVGRALADEVPAISVPPSSLSAAPGASVALSVTATGTAPLSYQWYRGASGDTASPVPGASGPLLVTPALYATTSFWVRVTNATGAADSSAAAVTITVPSAQIALFATGSNFYGQFGDGTTTSRLSPVPGDLAGNARAFAAGAWHTLFLHEDGSLWAAGMNTSGQLGDGSVTNRATPVSVATGVIAVVAGDSHSLFLKSDGTLWAMGNNSYGQLGDSTTTQRNSPVSIATGVTSISAGTSHSLFTKTDGSLWAMGRNNQGQLGDTTLTNRSTPVQIATGVASVSAGGEFTHFVKTNGSLWAMGYNLNGQLGDGTTTRRSTPVSIATGVVSTSAGSTHSTFIKSDGSLFAVGQNVYGQLGDGTTFDRTTPVIVGTNVSSVSAGAQYSVWLKQDGTLWGTGINTNGQLGDNTNYARATPAQIATGVYSAKAGGNHTVFLAAVHSVTFDLGLLGNRDGGGALVQTVRHGTSAIAPTFTVASGWAFTGWDVAFAAVTDDLTVTAQYVVPTQPAIAAPPADISPAYRSHAIISVVATSNAPLAYQWYIGESGDTSAPVVGATSALLVTRPLTATTRFWVRATNGGGSADSPAATITITPPTQLLALDASGTNNYGQLGTGNTTALASPVQVAAPVIAIAAGGTHSLFLRPDGSLWGMGFNGYGQLGDGTSANNRLLPVQITTNVAALAAGENHSHFLKTDGTLWGMGYNFNGELGDASTTSRATPVQIATGVAAVYAGYSHSLYIKTDGSLWSMGSNAGGQLGDGSNTNRTSPVKIATDVVSADAGYYHSVFVKADGTLWAVGQNLKGQLGDGTTIRRLVPVQIATAVRSVHAGSDHTVFRKTDGSVWATGSNSGGQLGDGTTTTRLAPVPSATGLGVLSALAASSSETWFLKTDATLWATNGTGFLQLASSAATMDLGSGHRLFLGHASTVTFNPGAQGTRTGGGELVQIIRKGRSATAPTLAVSSGWAFDGWDVAFDNITADLTVTARYVVPTAPVIVTPPTDAEYPAGSLASLALTATSNAPFVPLVYQWYLGESGDTSQPVPGAISRRLLTTPSAATSRYWVRVVNAGVPTDSPAATLTRTAAPPPFVLSAAGYNSNGALGDGSTTNRSTPVQIATDVLTMAGGYSHTLFVKTDGSLWATGYNSFGQLGNSSTTNRTTPVSVATGVIAASAGSYHSLFLKTGGSLWAMGTNSAGQLGDGTTTNRSTPVQITTNVAAIAASGEYSLFLKTDTTLWAMGYNYYGQLGDGTTTSRSSPVQIATGVVAIAAGGIHSLFLKSDASLWAAGSNGSGQLGDGTTVQRLTPVQVATDVIAIAAGSEHSLFLKGDHTLWAMGKNDSSQLGDGTTINRATPVQIATDVTAFSPGRTHSFFRKADGTLWAVGNNSYGQLCDGTTTSRATPVQVSPSVVAVVAGELHSLLGRTTHAVTFDLGSLGTRTGGGALVQTVFDLTAAVAPTLTVANGWAFSGWDVAFSAVTSDLTVTAQYIVPPPPTLTSLPQSVARPFGTSAVLTVAATSNAPFLPVLFQWYRGESGDTSSPVGGATGPLLVTPALRETSTFWVRVTNSTGPADSPAATITIPALVEAFALGATGRNSSGELG
ncbi:MAG: hypothetical protein RIQ79_1933, partial [Verrucomicrobiota bacterium]